MELEFHHYVETDGINSCAVERMEKNDETDGINSCAVERMVITVCFVGALSVLHGIKNAVLCFYP